MVALNLSHRGETNSGDHLFVRTAFSRQLPPTDSFRAAPTFFPAPQSPMSGLPCASVVSGGDFGASGVGLVSSSCSALVTGVWRACFHSKYIIFEAGLVGTTQMPQIRDITIAFVRNVRAPANSRQLPPLQTRSRAAPTFFRLHNLLCLGKRGVGG